MSIDGDKENVLLPYKWKQTVSELDVYFSVGEKKKKELSVVLTRTRISAGIKDETPIISGLFWKDINVDDSTWSVLDGVLTINIQKINKMEWWPCVIHGAPMIDTKKCVPENSKLSDLPADTRAMVEKMMFDQRQKMAGKPTSDDLKKEEMLKKFKEQHPEMDFSQAKFQ